MAEPCRIKSKIMTSRLNHFFPLTALLLVVLFFGAGPLRGQIVINEIQPGGTVEIKNLGTAAVDVSNYWLCDFPSYRRLGAGGTSIACGDLNLGAGEILTVDNFNVIDATDGKMGLYDAQSFGSADAMVDYVEWGSTGHGRSNVAVAAGIWQTGDFVAGFAGTQY